MKCDSCDKHGTDDCEGGYFESFLPCGREFLPSIRMDWAPPTLGEMADRLNTVLYMIRNHDVADDEETRFSESDVYMDQLPPKIRLACKIVLEEMKSDLLAIEVYCKYWLRQVTYEQIDEAGEIFRKEWIGGHTETKGFDGEELKVEEDCVKAWIRTARDWKYWR